MRIRTERTRNKLELLQFVDGIPIAAHDGKQLRELVVRGTELRIAL